MISIEFLNYLHMLASQCKQDMSSLDSLIQFVPNTRIQNACEFMRQFVEVIDKIEIICTKSVINNCKNLITYNNGFILMANILLELVNELRYVSNIPNSIYTVYMERINTNVGRTKEAILQIYKLIINKDTFTKIKNKLITVSNNNMEVFTLIQNKIEDNPIQHKWSKIIELEYKIKNNLDSKIESIDDFVNFATDLLFDLHNMEQYIDYSISIVRSSTALPTDLHVRSIAMFSYSLDYINCISTIVNSELANIEKLKNN
jgi:hypothetical protein